MQKYKGKKKARGKKNLYTVLLVVKFFYMPVLLVNSYHVVQILMFSCKVLSLNHIHSEVLILKDIFLYDCISGEENIFVLNSTL